MSLRTRLLLTLGLTLALLWGLAAAWLMRDLEEQFVATLDQRLAQSARMVAGLMAQFPEEVWLQADRRALSIPPIEGLACQVHSPRGEIMARTHTDLETILAAGERGHTFREEGGVTWRVFTYERGGLTITTADRMDERDQLLADVFKVAVVPFAVALLGSMVALWLGVLRGLAPLSRLRDSLARRHPDALAPVATYGVPMELRPLIETLNGLLARIQQAIVREQRFTSDAAHELKTPLTAIKTHLQVAGRVEGEAARQSLAYAEEGVGRLARILDQLLMLARVEGRVQFEDGEPSRVADVVELALRDTGVDPGCFALPEAWPEVDLALPRELAVTALRNLVDNALRHGGEGAPVTVTARLDEAAGELTLRVRDRGPGVDDKALAQMSQRFWRASKQRGSGLGLAIVMAIAERFAGRLEFARPDGEGLEACLTVPVKAGR
ncbi:MULTISPECIES: ATP-binding protein [unclassified Halomonas]|uniref:ATP-binding protein n=1 Tax=unclassified Halomonas TaxID=2609666 RepID=UPI000D7196D9|nr:MULTISPECIES: ATP-binding protein [unclassified Halomonas]PWV78174.1 signal transduction histidine kinase [Halomonas sp. A11-A]QJQ99941.1 two-component sensor histidine kinase [Halomonas sp. PGE1]